MALLCTLTDSWEETTVLQESSGEMCVVHTKFIFSVIRWWIGCVRWGIALNSDVLYVTPDVEPIFLVLSGVSQCLSHTGIPIGDCPVMFVERTALWSRLVGRMGWLEHWLWVQIIAIKVRLTFVWTLIQASCFSLLSFPISAKHLTWKAWPLSFSSTCVLSHHL